MNKRTSGVVKFFKMEKGYGFIAEDKTGEDVFFHFSRLVNATLVNEGDKVSFEKIPKLHDGEESSVASKIMVL